MGIFQFADNYRPHPLPHRGRKNSRKDFHLVLTEHLTNRSHEGEAGLSFTAGRRTLHLN